LRNLESMGGHGNPSRERAGVAAAAGNAGAAESSGA
jgi:hypothetical protein